MSKKNHPLAEFLRTHRSKIQPADVGLPAGARRRVAGLRREEVAGLAGISTDYYHRIEQGRERPSDQVLDAIARTLRLSPDATRYLRNVVANHLPRQNLATSQQALNPALQILIDGWPVSPTHIHDVGVTVVMANPHAAALSPSFATGGNPLRSLFLDAQMREFYRDWDGLTAWAVRWLRDFVGHHPDPKLHALIDDLRSRSARFDSLWATYDVRAHSRGLLQIDHPLVGPLDLHFQHLGLRGTEYTMVTYWADPQSPSDHALRRLAEVCGSRSGPEDY
ncbi:helix-turn-helix domain-containing protein [Mycolicibacterium vaccae]|uniref:DNA-binding protein n=1 Tax=Mycolicibacterium vaccae ATCC 25954 TaxID=1194972 RepID=K0UW46_MYCVA|nr:helix-turn-helix transcriptional regulator [Mycolicibacterium vaccae]ANI38573.1 DNA-binding protein [Mycolicibacterium vaccae 95051]EJZ06848.1 DNA-binding protein [Mycolicibacterium vaccae ATCC 25954]MCV7061403.1 helix-turn-helix domain-containing protein [Mycolicibacterium vaccae]